MLSYGGGQQSWGLLVKLVEDEDFRNRFAPGELWVAMSETSNEHPLTEMHTAYTRKFCRANEIPFTHIRPFMGFHTKTWLGLNEHHDAYGTIGSVAYNKTCTDNLKIKPFYKWLCAELVSKFDVPHTGKHGPKQPLVSFAEQYGKVNVMIGLDIDEKGRMAKAAEYEQKIGKWFAKAVVRTYPLIEWGWNRQAVQTFLRGGGYPVPPPSNCMRCFYMGPVELLWLARHHPEELAAWIEQERTKLLKNVDVGDRNLGVFGRTTIPEKLEQVEREFGHMTNDELTEYKMSHGHCVASHY